MDRTGGLRITAICCDCGHEFEKTGRNHKRCAACKYLAVKRGVYDWRVRTGAIKKPGVGKGGGQVFGPGHHSYKSGTGVFRRFKKEACERCGSTKNLCAHHKDRNRKNNVEENIETLCKSCHQKEHIAHANFNADGKHNGRMRAMKRQRGIDGRFK